MVAERWAAQGGAGTISTAQVSAGLRSRARLDGDIALAVLPGVREAWERLVDDPARVEEVLVGLATSTTRGVLVPGYRPGPQLERVLRMGGMARTVTLGRVRYTSDGAGVQGAQTAVLVQAGRTNLLFEGDGGAVSLSEVNAVGMLKSLQEVYRPA